MRHNHRQESIFTCSLHTEPRTVLVLCNANLCLMQSISGMEILRASTQKLSIKTTSYLTYV
jgi:hypothetical protein